MNQLKFASASMCGIRQNAQHSFAMRHGMMIYRSNALYSFIPKNGCSTLRLSVAVANGCIGGIDRGHWIHNNNETFNPSLGEAIAADYSFVVLRCPFRRLASVFLDKFVSKEPPAWGYRDSMQRKIELDSLTFRSFVLSLKQSHVMNADIHWRSQESFLIYENYSDYFSLERFGDAVNALKDKIDLDVIDARELTRHGTDGFETVDDRCYADMEAFDLALMKRQGLCPSHFSMYDDELIHMVSALYKADLALYREKFSDDGLLFK